MNFRAGSPFFGLFAAAGLALCPVSPITAAEATPTASPSPSGSRALLREGLAALQKDDLDTARARLGKFLESEPDNIVALVNLGSAEYRARHLEEAEKWLKKAVRLQPGTFAAWQALGVVAYDEGKLDLALAALAQAVMLDPSSARAHSYLGVTVGRKGWLDGAESELQRAVQLDDSDADAHFNLAVIYLQRKPPAAELARREYRRARELGAKPDPVVEKQLGESKESVKSSQNRLP